jgi:hypothetical protein
VSDSLSPLELPDRLSVVSAGEMERALLELWRLTVGTAPLELSQDLALLRRWFDPVAQGGRLRKELAALPAIPENWRNPGAPYVMSVGDAKWLVTPEGRCVLELLRTSERGEQYLSLREADVTALERELLRLYRDWSRHRLDSVIGLLQGTTKPLQVAAAGVLVALLVNRSTAEDRAMIRFSGGTARDVVDQAFFAAVHAFSSVLSPNRRSSSDPRLISGWMLYEAGRRIGDGLVVTDAKDASQGKVFIRPGTEEHVLTVVARDLARGNRARVSLLSLSKAYDNLVEEFRRELPRLAAYGLAYERPSETARLRERLLQKAEIALESHA